MLYGCYCSRKSKKGLQKHLAVEQNLRRHVSVQNVPSGAKIHSDASRIGVHIYNRSSTVCFKSKLGFLETTELP